MRRASLGTRQWILAITLFGSANWSSNRCALHTRCIADTTRPSRRRRLGSSPRRTSKRQPEAETELLFNSLRSPRAVERLRTSLVSLKNSKFSAENSEVILRFPRHIPTRMKDASAQPERRRPLAVCRRAVEPVQRRSFV